MTAVGIVGNGVVGKATGDAFANCGMDVKRWDVSAERCQHSLKEVLDTGLVFVCLPTPPMGNGACDVYALQLFFTDVQVDSYKNLTTFVIRSTTPVGFTNSVSTLYSYPSVYHWPEFLDAATADRDAAHPRCVILGKAGGFGTYKDGPYHLIMGCFPWLDEGLCVTSDESEAIKLFVNTFFCVKNAAFNEFHLFADAKGLDWERVVNGILADGRISPVHTRVPGPDGRRGFGGACLPKDLDSMIRQMLDAGVPAETMAAAYRTNTYVRPKE